MSQPFIRPSERLRAKYAMMKPPKFSETELLWLRKLVAAHPAPVPMRTVYPMACDLERKGWLYASHFGSFGLDEDVRHIVEAACAPLIPTTDPLTNEPRIP